MSESIIEKLGIEPIKTLPVKNGFVCDSLEVRIKEKVFNRMLMALIEEYRFQEDNDCHNDEAYVEMLSIIEESCHPNKWEDIKKILETP